MYQPRVNTRNQSHGNRNNGSRLPFNNRQRPQRNMSTHDTTETHINDPSSKEDIFHESIGQGNDPLIDHVTQRKPLPPGYLHWLLSNNNNTITTTPPNNNTHNIPGQQYLHKMHYT